MFASKSHAMTMLPLAERLAENGHNVSMFTVTADKLHIKSKKVQFFESHFLSDNSTFNNKKVGEMFWNKELSPQLSAHPYKVGLDFLEKSYKNEEMEKLFSTKFDVAIVDESYTSLQGAIALKLRQIHQTKIILFATTDILFVSSHYRGLGRNPVVLPTTFLKSSNVYSKGESFLERTILISNYLLDLYYSGPVASSENEKAGNLLELKGATKKKLFDQAIINLSDYPTIISSPSPIGSDFFPIGEHCPTNIQLPSDISEFVNEPTSQGTIYVAFGSYVNLDDGPPGTITIFKNALAHFKNYRVIWSYKGKVIDSTPHIKITSWAPQKDILNAQKTKLFFTHGGLKSTKEGICAGTPMLFLPFYADQSRNAQSCVNLGIAESIWKGNLTVEEIVGKIEKVLKNEQFYKSNIEKIRKIYQDNLMDSLNFGVFQINKAVKLSEKHFYKFKRFSINLSWLEFLNFDILCISVFLIIISSF